MYQGAILRPTTSAAHTSNLQRKQMVKINIPIGNFGKTTNYEYHIHQTILE
jgi:hypothetical protein